jgi:hypothetical protein
MTSSGPTAAAGPPGPPPRRRRGYWIPGLIAMAALLAIALALGAGDLDHHKPTVLHGTEVAREIALAIQVQERTHAAPDVRCPASAPVQVGYRFVCTALRAGSTGLTHVDVQEIDSRGHLRWQLRA